MKRKPSKAPKNSEAELFANNTIATIFVPFSRSCFHANVKTCDIVPVESICSARYLLWSGTVFSVVSQVFFVGSIRLSEGFSSISLVMLYDSLVVMWRLFISYANHPVWLSTIFPNDS